MCRGLGAGRGTPCLGKIWLFFTERGVSGYIQSHDVVRHVVTVSDVEIPAFQFPHAHALIKFHRPGVITVHIQAHLARFRMDAPDVADSVAEQKASDV